MLKPIEVRKLRWKAGKGLPYCQKCGAYATSEALFDVGTYIMARRYCEKCLSAAEYDN